MKFATAIVNALAVAVLFAVDAEAVGVRGGANRELQDGQVNCITVTGSNGSVRTVAPCTTVPPASTSLRDEDDQDDEDDEDDRDDVDMDVESEDGVLVTNPSPPSNPSPPARPQQSVISGMTTSTEPPLLALAMQTPELSSLSQLLFASGLATRLKRAGPFTVFAPVNAALPSGAALLQLEANPDLTDILGYHVVPGLIRSTDLVDGAVATTVQGSDITASVSATGVKINDANVIRADVEASNGIVHFLDAVLMPPDTPVVAPPVTAGSSGSLQTTPAAPANPTALSTGRTNCGPFHLTELSCELTNGLVGVFVCRGGFTTCVPPSQTMAGDTCGCCFGDLRPGCMRTYNGPFASGNEEEGSSVDVDSRCADC